MSIVRYVDKKTGRVALYESTSHYNPETKQSRPIRKYLGTEDPITGELIPSTGKPGRKVGSGDEGESKSKSTEAKYRSEIEELKKRCAEKDNQIKKLEHQNGVLISKLEQIRDFVLHSMEE